MMKSTMLGSTIMKHSTISFRCVINSRSNFSATASTILSSSHEATTTTTTTTIKRPLNMKMGWSKEVIADLLPFTSELITSRGRSFENMAVGYCVPHQHQVNKDAGIVSKRVEDSWLELIFPFSDHQSLRDNMARNDGTTIRYGKLFEILDALAADVSYRHCEGRLNNGCNLVVVTASVDGVTASANIDLNNDLKLQGYLSYVGTSSMEVTIDMITVDKCGTERKIGETQFIMVARNSVDGLATKVFSLSLSDQAAIDKFKSGKNRALIRKLKAKESLSITPPRTDEVDIMHGLYLESKFFKTQKDALLKGKMGSAVNTTAITTTAIAAIPNDASNASGINNFIWMKNTIFKNVLLMHVQDRNIHGKIFGGFIMREAFELAWVASVCFLGEKVPVFTSVDDIQFVKPVNIGSIMEFVATVVYSEAENIVVLVKAYDVNHTTGVRMKTNKLSYVFRSQGSKVPQVKPKEYEEYVLYLEGRRSLKDQMSRQT